MRLNYVDNIDNIYINTVRLNMCLEDPTEHDWREDGSAEWKKNYFPVNLDDVGLKLRN